MEDKREKRKEKHENVDRCKFEKFSTFSYGHRSIFCSLYSGSCNDLKDVSYEFFWLDLLAAHGKHHVIEISCVVH